MSKRIIQVTAKEVRSILKEELGKIIDVGHLGPNAMGVKSNVADAKDYYGTPKEVQADEFEDTLEQHVDYYQKLGIQETKLGEAIAKAQAKLAEIRKAKATHGKQLAEKLTK